MFLIDDLLIIGDAAIGGGIVGALIGIAIDVFLDDSSLGEEVHTRYPDALKLLIQEKKSNAVKVGIFGENEREIESNVEITSSKGISNNLYVGQEIYL